MFGDRQQLDVTETGFLDVLHQLVRQFPIVQEFAFRPAPPRADMDLVDGHRLMQPVGLLAPFQPVGIAPGIDVRLGDDGGGAGTQLELLAVGIGLQHDRAAIAVADLELVQIARAHVGDEQLPYAAAATHPHGVDSTVPAVEIADHADPFGAGCPHRE